MWKFAALTDLAESLQKTNATPLNHLKILYDIHESRALGSSNRTLELWYRQATR